MLKPLAIILFVVTLIAVIRKLFIIKITSQGIDIKPTARHRANLIIRNNIIVTALLFTSAIVYAVVVSKISIYNVARYVFCIYPIIAIITTLLIYKIIRLISAKKVASIVTIISALILLAGQYTWFLPIGKYPDTLHTADRPLNSYMEANRNNPCIYIYNKGGMGRDNRCRLAASMQHCLQSTRHEGSWRVH